MYPTRALRSPAVALGLAIALVLGSGACGGDDDSANPSSSSSTGSVPGTSAKVTAGATPEVKLIEPGADPRAKLRLALQEGLETRAALTMKIGLELEADGKPLPSGAVPPIRVGLVLTVKELKENGDARVEFAYESIEVVDDGTIDKAVIEQVRKSGIDKLADLKGKATITTRGVAKDSSVSVPDDLPAAMKQIVDQLSQQTGNLTVPFPEEAVGPGARWTATTRVDTGGIKANLLLTYTLRQIEADRFVLDVAYEQTAGRQKADFPGLPEGTEVEVQDLLVKGKGEVTSTLASVFPSRSSLSAAGTVNLNVSGKGQGGQAQKGKLLQRLSLDLLLENLPPT